MTGTISRQATAFGLAQVQQAQSQALQPRKLIFGCAETKTYAVAFDGTKNYQKVAAMEPRANVALLENQARLQFQLTASGDQAHDYSGPGSSGLLSLLDAATPGVRNVTGYVDIACRKRRTSSLLVAYARLHAQVDQIPA